MFIALVLIRKVDDYLGAADSISNPYDKVSLVIENTFTKRKPKTKRF